MRVSGAREFTVSIDTLDQKAQGVGRVDGKMAFVEDALPGETVVAKTLRRTPNYQTARTIQVLKPSWQRVTPRCAHFGVCGGCSLQHLAPAAQVAVKQRALEDAFARMADLRPQHVLAPIHGPYWGYRFRARLSVRYVARRDEVLVGFRERKSSFVADVVRCEILPKRVSDLLVPLRRLVESLSIMARVPQIEVAVGGPLIALVLRHLEPLTDEDRTRLGEFARHHDIQWWLQAKGPESVHLLDETDSRELAYELPEFGLRMAFRPTDFTQINHPVNRELVKRAITLLDPQPDERILDLFCGLGNFTLALARRSGQVLGLEGNQALVERARDAAQRHGLDNVSFEVRDLFEMTASDLVALGRFDQVLIDPGREGALAVVESIAELAPEYRPRRIVYVSCNLTTLARDAAVLHHKAGYRLCAAGVINMFAHTSHVESIAVFE